VRTATWIGEVRFGGNSLLRASSTWRGLELDREPQAQGDHQIQGENRQRERDAHQAQKKERAKDGDHPDEQRQQRCDQATEEDQRE
jgi:hypothetical protein